MQASVECLAQWWRCSRQREALFVKAIQCKLCGVWRGGGADTVVRLTLESMKMEIKIVAPRAGNVHYFVVPKQAVHEGMVLFDIK